MRKDTNEYRVLLIEDNSGDALLIEDFLEEKFLKPQLQNVVSYSDAKKELNKKEYDVILLDLTLPDLSGMELIKSVMKDAGQIPVIILTGLADFGFAVSSIDKGISDYLLKDELNPSTLYKSILYSIQRCRYIQQLKESHSEYRRLFHLSPQPMWVYDMETLNFFDVNNAAIDKYGYTLDEFMAMTVNEIKADLNEIKEREEEYLSDMKDKVSFKNIYHHKLKNGQIIQVELHNSYYSLNGRPMRLVLASDISARLKYIRDVEGKNKALKNIAWTQSHKVRAPLARILGLAELLKNDNLSKSELNDILKKIVHSSRELDELIHQIVEIANTTEIKTVDE